MRSSELECALMALDEMQAQRDEARALVRTEQQRYLSETELLRGVVSVLNASVHRLTAERDKARREVCALEADTIEDQREYAKQRGWNCFGPNTCKEAQHDLEADTHPG